MLNWRFIKHQWKSIWVIVLVCAIILLIFVLISNIGLPFLSEKMLWTPTDDHGRVLPSLVFYSGSFYLIKTFLFGAMPLFLFLIFGTVMSTRLLSTDISHGYVASWLTTPMSRTKIFNSKLITLISAVFILNLWIMITQLVSYGIFKADLKYLIGPLLLGNLTLFLFTLLVVSITWIVFATFNRTMISWGICFGIIGWFALCSILTDLSRSQSGLENLKYFQYFNLQSLLHSPWTFSEKFSDLPSGLLKPNSIYIRYSEVSIKALDFVWQLPVMFVGAIGIFTGAQFIVKDKDFAF